jgi:hypothetical protein
MTVVPLDAGAIDRLLALPAWREEAGAVEVEVFASEAEKIREFDRLHAAIRQALAREATGFLIEAAFAIRDPLQIAALLGRAPCGRVRSHSKDL